MNGGGVPGAVPGATPGAVPGAVPGTQTPGSPEEMEGYGEEHGEGAGGGQGQIPSFPEESAEHAVQQIVLKVAAGQTEGLADYIALSAKNVAKELRGPLSDERLKELSASMSRVTLHSQPRVTNEGLKRVVLRNAQNEILQFNCKMEGGRFKVVDLTIKPIPARLRY